jgi:DNA-binding LacI/PurR family transcriptional regulator
LDWILNDHKSTNRTADDRSARSGATIADVAALAGVSRQTVSNVLNAPHRVAPATTTRVQKAIQKLEYRQNRAARNLRIRASHTIGLRINPVMGLGDLLDRFLHALANSAQAAGYHVLLFTSTDPETEIATYDDLIQTGTVDGFVLTDIGIADPRPAWFARRRIPFVCFGRPSQDRAECAWVDVDGAYGTAQAVDYLVSCGHRRIAYLGWPHGTGYGDDRRAGWRQAMRRHGLPITRLAGTCTQDAGAAAETAGRLLAGTAAPTAFVCGSDTFAIGARLACGNDIDGQPLAAVVGFDDSPAATFLSPPLSSVRQPLPAVAHHVVDLLVGKIADPGARPEGILLRPELVHRDARRS